MSRAPAVRATPVVWIQRFLRTPKGLLTVVLIALVGAAAPAEGVALVAKPLVLAVGVAALIDLPILRLKNGDWSFPSGAILTGLLIAMIMSPHEPWYATAATAGIAIVSKYAARGRSANVFNPAALAIVATFYLFDTGQDWWGALPDLPPIALALLVAGGAFIADRVNKMPMVIVFLGVYYGLFTLQAFVGDPRRVAEVFRTPDLQAVVFFACFILTDPPTSPTRYVDQMWSAAIVAVVSYGIFTWLGVAYYLLAGVLAGNVWEAGRRYRVHARRQAAAAG